MANSSNPGRRPQAGPEADEVRALSEQFRVTLRAAADKIEARGGSDEALGQIKKLLSREDWRWKDAYEAEQQLVLLYDEDTLRTELSRRILEAGHVLFPDTAAWYRERAKQATTAEEQRALLLRLVNDLQWRYTVNETKSGYIRQITGRTSWIFIFAVVAFIAFLFLVLFFGDSLTAMWKPSERFLIFLLAAVSGCLGASFSMMASLKTRLVSAGINQMKNAGSRSLLFSRVLVGNGAAMILFFFFESGLLKGAAFPNLDTIDDRQVALLIVWGFVAGFSEKLVPGLLSKTEAQANGPAQAAPDGTITAADAPPADTARPPSGPAGDASATGSANPGATQDKAQPQGN